MTAPSLLICNVFDFCHSWFPREGGKSTQTVLLGKVFSHPPRMRQDFSHSTAPRGRKRTSALLFLGTEGTSQSGPGCSAEGQQCQASCTPKTQDQRQLQCSHNMFCPNKGIRVKVLSYFTQFVKTLAVIPWPENPLAALNHGNPDSKFRLWLSGVGAVMSLLSSPSPPTPLSPPSRICYLTPSNSGQFTNC